MEYPRLVESNVKAYLYNTLNRCHEYKTSIFSWVFNISVFLGLVFIIGIILYLKRKRELPEWEKEAKMLQEQNYVLSKIREYQMDQKRQTSMITDLPFTYNPDNI
ncbi:hypothetical protein EBQ91_00375 [bacterium]|jgi:hypothetical protein|nr:hypothetical protein [bacterium]